MNPLEQMTWEERFYAALNFGFQMEARALQAEQRLAESVEAQAQRRVLRVAARKYPRAA